MTTLKVTSKGCSRCEEIKPLSQFYRNRGTKDGRQSHCAACSLAATIEQQKRKRAEMGEVAWLESRRINTANSRARTGNETGKATGRARTQAHIRLAEMYPKPFARIYSEERLKQGLHPDPDYQRGRTETG